MKKALSVERLGGTCMFNMVAQGETLLFGQLKELIEMVTSLGHYARIVTNGTLTEPLKKLMDMPTSSQEKLVIKFSTHYLELKKRGLLDKYFDNIKMIRDNNVAFSVELCASDEFVPYIDEIKAACIENVGAIPHIVELRNQEIPGYPRLTKMEINEYQNIWQSFDSPLFNYETRNYEKYQNKFCYGGEYGMVFSWQTGEVSSCSCEGNKRIFNIFENPEEPLNFVAVGRNCPSAHCFTNYMWSVFAGNYDDYPMPTYAEERDRTTPDGRHWLTPIFREVYSQRCSQFHNPYSEDKSFFVDLLMRKLYKGYDPNPDELNRLSSIVKDEFVRRNIRTVAIYGMGGMGNWLKSILSNAGIAVNYAIDKCANTIKTDIPVYSPEADIPPVDAIVISVFAEFSNIAPLLKKKAPSDVISLSGFIRQ
jgi:hypothetical protein